MEIKNVNKKFAKGFTLLELLVVVIIIAILAAIALPKYQKAIAKSKAVQMYDAVSTMAKAAQAFYLTHNSWPTSFDDLDIDYNLIDTKSSACGSSFADAKKNDNFEFLIGQKRSSTTNFNQVSVRLINGPYKCTGFSIFFYALENPDIDNRLLCYEKISDSYRGSKNKLGDFCEKVMGYKFYKKAFSANFFIQ